MSQVSPTGSRKGEPLSKRSYTLRLTFSSMLTAGIVLIIGIGWAFVLGVMVGRGYNPEQKVPQLANLLPAEQSASLPAREKVGDDLPKAEVMKPEELRYASTLKGKPGQITPEPKPKNMQNATAHASVPVPLTPAAPGTAAAHATAVPPPAAEAPKPPQPPASAPMFDYVFQVATFKDTDSVDKLRARLEGRGLRTRMDKDGKLFKVMVLLRGTAESAQGVQQQMVELGLGQPIQRGRTPAGKSR